MRDTARDILIDKLVKHYNISSYGLTIYAVMAINPLDAVVSILAAKLGLSKLAITLIIAFLI